MNAILATISAQFSYAAPSTLTVGGKAYNRKGGIYDNAAGIVRFDFVGRKQRGAMIADKVIVSVSYDAGAEGPPGGVILAKLGADDGVEADSVIIRGSVVAAYPFLITRGGTVSSPRPIKSPK